MNPQSLGNDRLHGHPWIEAGKGILENDLHAAPVGPHFGVGQLHQVHAFEEDFACRRLDQPKNRTAGRRFAGAGFTDQADDVALLDGEGNILDRMYLRPLARKEGSTNGKALVEIPDGKQWS